MTDIKYAGKSFLKDLGVYVDSIQSYGTPRKDYTFHEVLGRNGSLAVDNHRFDDHEETFNCYIKEDFVPKYRAVTAFLNAVKGYQRLERANEQEYFEKAIFEGSIGPAPTQLLKAGSFPLRFRMHPEKWLKSGEIAVDASSNPTTLSGNPIQIDNPSGLTVLTDLQTAFSPKQDLNGYDHPWIGGAGKNKLPYPFYRSQSYAEIEGLTAVIENGVITFNGTVVTAGDYELYNASYDPSWESLNGGLKGDFVLSSGSSDIKVSARIRDISTGTSRYVSGSVVDITTGESEYINRIYLGSTNFAVGKVFSDVVVYPMIRLASETDDSWEPYENICPISGHTSATVTRTVDGSETDYTIDLNGTVYGGTLDVMTGVLTVTHAIIDMGDMRWSKSARGYFASTVINSEVKRPSDYASLIGLTCSCYKEVLSNDAYYGRDIGISVRSNTGNIWAYDPQYETASDFTTAVTGQKLCYELAEPQTYTLTAQQISLLTGVNYISTDGDTVTVTITEPSVLENPTLFESKPMVRIYGTGMVNINNDYITIAESSPFSYIDLDCETMNASSDGSNANQYVTISTEGLLTLKPGTNYIAHSGNITKVEVTPRWYTV